MLKQLTTAQIIWLIKAGRMSFEKAIEELERRSRKTKSTVLFELRSAGFQGAEQLANAIGMPVLAPAAPRQNPTGEEVPAHLRPVPLPSPPVLALRRPAGHLDWPTVQGLPGAREITRIDNSSYAVRTQDNPNARYNISPGACAALTA